MADCIIENLHLGMNLRDPAAAIPAGETGLSLGCDFSVPGQVTPMRSGLLTWTLGTNITDGRIIYLGDAAYLFTTHFDGLRVTYGGNSYLIDPLFTGTFKALPINDEYVVFANGTYNRKWKPGWTTTYQWGLNTPPAPSVSAGTSLTKTVDDFESLTSWAFTGGGASGNLQADTTHIRRDGTQSMRLTLDSETTIVATRTLATPLDLSKFVSDGDIGATPYLNISYYTDDLAAIQAITLKLSCAADGAFTKDYYKLVVTLGGYVYATLSPTGETGSGTYEATLADMDNPPVFTGSWETMPQYWVKKGDTPKYYELQPDGVLKEVSESEIPFITRTEIITIQAKKRDIVSASGTWTDFQAPLTKFSRIGDTAVRDWSTITAIAIEVEASSANADLSFDDWKMVGGGNLFGYYYVAAAYQNDQGNYGPFTDFAGPVELNAQSLLVSGLTPDTDAQTTKRRLAILGGALTQPMVAYVENNTDSDYEFNTLETSLTTVESYFNNKPPPASISDMAEINGRIFIVAATNSLIYSEPLLYESFPLKNYRIFQGGEKLYQVGLFADGYVAARGKGREYITQVTGATPAFWPSYLGATQGAVSSRLLLQDPAGPQVFMCERGFYVSSPGVRGEYLEKINPVIANHSQVFGDMIPDRAYLYYQDTGGVDRLLRIDYRLGRPVAHYVENLQPSCIFADNIANKVYYAVAERIYEFDAGTTKLAATITIPNLLCGDPRLKSFETLSYELETAALTAAFTLDRVAQSGTTSIPVVSRNETPLTLPFLVGGVLQMVLTSNAEDDFTMLLPWIIEQVRI